MVDAGDDVDVDVGAVGGDVVGTGSLLDELDGSGLDDVLDAADDVTGGDVEPGVGIGVEGGRALPSPPHPTAHTSRHASVRSPLRACHRGLTSSPYRCRTGRSR